MSFFQWLVSIGVSFRGVMFILVGVIIMGVDHRGVFVAVCFRVFRLCTVP